jgi:hypothetical protein
MSGLPSTKQEDRSRQLRRATASSWLLTVVICVVLLVLDVVPVIVVVAFLAMDTVVLALVARSGRGSKDERRGPGGL